MTAYLTSAFAAFRVAGEPQGAIDGAAARDAFVWIGAFRKGLPAQRPAAGMLRRGDGVLRFPTPQGDRYTILAAAIAPAWDWRAYLVSGNHVRVATSGPVAARGDTRKLVALRLRALSTLDPPILAALPLLAFQ